MQIVCVLDMDETLGVFYKNVFHVRPKIDILINLLRLQRVDIILWSLGDDNYVKRVVNGYLPQIAQYAYKIFARSEGYASKKLYNYTKAAEHIRDLYDESIFLMAVDDNVNRNMNSNYDVRIHIKPYNSPNPNDRAILNVVEKIIQTLGKVDPYLQHYDERENEIPM